MSPDWADTPQPVPFAEFTDPQTLNLYVYGRNNPVNNRDLDGHCTVDGEEHGWLWCAAHSIGLTQTYKERADAAREALSQMHGFTIGGQAPADIAKTGTNGQVISAQRAVINYFSAEVLLDFAGRCAEGVLCGTAPLIGGRPVFRDGASLAARANEVRLGPGGMLRAGEAGRGISVDLDASVLAKFGGPRQIISLPDESVQKGPRPTHFEIVPKQPMTFERYQQLLNQIVLKE